MRKILLLLSILIGIPLWAQTKQHISYTVKEGDTLENIAKVYRLSPNDIKSLNPALAEKGLQKGMILLLPGEEVSYFNKKQPSGFQTHEVKDKETLYGLAQKYGVKPVADRKEAENRKAELVYMASSPYYHVDKLNNSVPYLVPRAAVLLNDIGRNFFDSLQIKGIPLHKFIVTSVLRSEADVKKLRGHNGNASENSCHRFGTTFDIAYNRYKTVESPDGPARRKVRNDTLKWVMSEVLNDLRRNERCYIKYEVKQGCFHVTVR